MKRNMILIGNSLYDNLDALPFVEDDLNCMERSLNIDKVSRYTNLTKEKMIEYITKFVEKAERESLNIIYFSGHGVMANGKNCLCGTDSRSDGNHLEYTTIFEIISNKSFCSKFLLIFDACRDGDFYSDMKIPDHVCLFASAQISEQSAGDDKDGSVFTKCFINVLKENKHLPIRELLFKVQKEFDLTCYEQTPIILDRLLEKEIYIERQKYEPINWNGIQEIDKIIYQEVMATKGDVLEIFVKLSKQYEMPLLLVNHYFHYNSCFTSNIEPFNYEINSNQFLDFYKSKLKKINSDWFYENEKIDLGEIPDSRIGEPKKSKKINTEISRVRVTKAKNKIYIKAFTKIIDGFILHVQSNIFYSFLKGTVKGGQFEVSIDTINLKKQISDGDKVEITITSPVVEVQPVWLKNRIGHKGRNLYGDNVILDLLGKMIFLKTETIVKDIGDKRNK